MSDILTTAELRALGRVFAAEVDGRLPFQSKAKIFRKLCEAGMVEPMERTLGGRLPVTVSGYQLTHAGRLAYCCSCRDEV